MQQDLNVSVNLPEMPFGRLISFADFGQYLSILNTEIEHTSGRYEQLEVRDRVVTHNRITARCRVGRRVETTTTWMRYSSQNEWDYCIRNGDYYSMDYRIRIEDY